MDQKYIRDNYKVIKESPWLGGKGRTSICYEIFPFI